MLGEETLLEANNKLLRVYRQIITGRDDYGKWLRIQWGDIRLGDHVIMVGINEKELGFMYGKIITVDPNTDPRNEGSLHKEGEKGMPERPWVIQGIDVPVAPIKIVYGVDDE